jgi:Rod binding domain-containing protein
MSFSALSSVSPAALPAAVRNGTAADKAAYAQGLQFEQVLVNQLTQQLSQTASGTSGGASGDGSSSDPSSSSDGGSGGLFGSGASANGYSSLLTQTLSSAIMSGGGVGIATEIAKAIDPRFGEAAATKTKGKGTTG